MKRLLAYLFIVFGLALISNVIADDIKGTQYKWNRNTTAPDYWVTWDFKKLFGMCYMMKNKDLNNYEYCYEIDKQTFLLMKKAAKEVASGLNSNQLGLFYDRLVPIRRSLYEDYKTKIAKAEPSQTQTVKKINFPKSLLDPYNKGTSGRPPKDEWLNHFNKSNSNVTIWTGIRNSTGSKWSYAWRGRYNLDTALKDAFSGCEKRKKDRGSAFTEFNLCVPLYIKYKGNNGRDTSDEEKIKFMTEYHGKNKTINFFKKSINLWALNDKSLINSLQIAESKPKKKPEAPNNDQASLDEERRKIEEEKKKIEEEKRKIAEAKKKREEEKRKIAEAKKKREEEEKKRKEANAKLYVIGSGTGFFVSSSGHAVSNEHVVGICRKVATKIDGEKVFFNILKTDQVNDLGLIKGDYTSPNFLSIKSDGAEFGEDIVAFGYPLRGILSSSVKLTRGIVSSLSGLNDNYSEIQIDAAIQPGNSGGPVLNMEGQVVGVASSGLNKLAMIEEAEYIPENVNFAVAAPTLHNFLKSNGVNTKNTPLKINNTKELAKIGRPATIQLFCLNTKAKHEELKNKKKHSDVLLEKVIELN